MGRIRGFGLSYFVDYWSEGGDWHSHLVAYVNHAIAQTDSAALRKELECVAARLSEMDECAQTVTLTAELPVDVDIDTFRKALRNFPEKAPSVEFMGGTRIVKIVSEFRSTKTYAEKTAIANLNWAMDYCARGVGL